MINNIKIIIILISIAILGLIAVQIVWINNAFALKKSQFDQDIRQALVQVVQEVPKIVHFNHEQKLKNVKNINDYFFQQIVADFSFNLPQDKISSKQLDSLIKNVFTQKGINTNYEFAVFNSTGKPYFFKDKQSLKYQTLLLKEGMNIQLFQGDIFSNNVFLSVFFPQKGSYVFTQMWGIMSVSLLLILIVIYAFYYTVNTIHKQKKLSEIKNDFINNMTHELKTPISTIQLACEALKDPDMQKTENKNTFVEVIDKENKRLGSLVETVLKTAVLDKGQLKLNKQPFDLLEKINQVIHSFDLKIKQVQGSLSLKSDLVQVVVNGDEEHLSNVFRNLIDNAIKYSKGSPKIELLTKLTETKITILVQDNGIGISKENQTKIFDKLYRVPTGNLHDVKGFGLGLNYVKSIVELHEGTVKVKSNLGKGTSFFVELPLLKKRINFEPTH